MRKLREALPLVSAIVIGLSACSPDADAARTVSWFEQHSDERKAVLAKCQDDPGHLAQTPNCMNASEAEGRASIGSVRDLPPLNLPLPGKTPARPDSGARHDQ